MVHACGFANYGTLFVGWRARQAISAHLGITGIIFVCVSVCAL